MMKTIMEKVLKEIRSLYFIRRYTTINYYNVTGSYGNKFHDPLLKQTQSVGPSFTYTIQRERKKNKDLTGWRYVSLLARKEGIILKSLYIANDSFCTCPDFQYRKKKKQQCKHMIDLEVKKQTFKVTKLFTGEPAIKSLIDSFVGHWVPPPKPHCDKFRCEKKAVWLLDNGTKLCKRHLPKVVTVPLTLPFCEEPWCEVKAKNILPCGRKVCGRHIPKVTAKKL